MEIRYYGRHEPLLDLDLIKNSEHLIEKILVKSEFIDKTILYITEDIAYTISYIEDTEAVYTIERGTGQAVGVTIKYKDIVYIILNEMFFIQNDGSALQLLRHELLHANLQHQKQSFFNLNVKKYFQEPCTYNLTPIAARLIEEYIAQSSCQNFNSPFLESSSEEIKQVFESFNINLVKICEEYEADPQQGFAETLNRVKILWTKIAYLMANVKKDNFIIPVSITNLPNWNLYMSNNWQELESIFKKIVVSDTLVREEYIPLIEELTAFLIKWCNAIGIKLENNPDGTIFFGLPIYLTLKE